MEILSNLLIVHFVLLIIWFFINKRSNIKLLSINIITSVVMVFLCPIIYFVFTPFPYFVFTLIVILIIFSIWGIVKREQSLFGQKLIPLIVGSMLSFIWISNIREFNSRFNVATSAWKLRIPIEPIFEYQTQNNIAVPEAILPFTKLTHICPIDLHKWKNGIQINSTKDTLIQTVIGNSFKNDEITFTHFAIVRKRINDETKSLFTPTIGHYIYVYNQRTKEDNVLYFHSTTDGNQIITEASLNNYFKNNFNHIMAKYGFYNSFMGVEYINKDFWLNLLEKDESYDRCI